MRAVGLPELLIILVLLGLLLALPVLAILLFTTRRPGRASGPVAVGARVCPHCQQRIPDLGSFCSFCGQRIV